MFVAPPFCHQMARIAPSTPTPPRPPEKDLDESLMDLWEFGREISMILPSPFTEKSRWASFCLSSDKYFYTLTPYLTICSVQWITERYRDVTAINARRITLTDSGRSHVTVPCAPCPGKTPQWRSSKDSRNNISVRCRQSSLVSHSAPCLTPPVQTRSLLFFVFNQKLKLWFFLALIFFPLCFMPPHSPLLAPPTPHPPLSQSSSLGRRGKMGLNWACGTLPAATFYTHTWKVRDQKDLPLICNLV